MFIVVGDLGGKTVSVLGFCSPISGCRPRRAPVGRKSALPPQEEEGPSRLWLAALYLLDSRLSVSRQSSQDA